MTDLRRRPPNQVMWPVSPAPGESLLAWVSRTAHRNVLPGCYTLLRRAGQDYLDRPSFAFSGPIGVDLLARILGSSREEVEERRLRPADAPGFSWLNGVRVRTDAVGTTTRRFSPPTLARTRTHSAAAMVRSVPYCPDGWELMRDACTACGATQKWRHAGDMTRCDSCNARLAEQFAEEVAPELRDRLARVAALIGADPERRTEALSMLPQSLDGLDAGAALELVVAVAGILDPGLPLDPPARTVPNDQRRRCVALADAWEILLGYPESFGRLVTEEQAGRARLRGAWYPSKASRKETLPEVAAAFVAALGPADGDPTCGLKVKPAARLLGATETEVADARDAGRLLTRIVVRDGRICRNLDRDEVERLSEARSDRVGHDAAAASLGLPAYAVPQLASTDLLAWNDHPWLVERFGDPQLSGAAVEELRTRLRDRASPSGEATDGVPLAKVMKGFGSGPKPWSAVFAMLSDGRLPFTIRGHGVNTGSLIVGHDALRTIRTLAPGSTAAFYSQRDALEILNMNLKAAAHLREVGGAARPGKGWRVPGEEVRRVAAERVSYAELMVRTGMPPRSLLVLTLGRGLEPPSAFGWQREPAEAALADLLG